jgi:hypothetical protein
VPGIVPPVINAAQFDSDRPFQLEIMDGSAAADLTGLSVKIDGLKPDNNGFQYDETSMVGAHYVVSVTGNEKIAAIMNTNKDTICGDVLADNLTDDTIDGFAKEWNINGETVTLTVQKV